MLRSSLTFALLLAVPAAVGFTPSISHSHSHSHSHGSWVPSSSTQLTSPRSTRNPAFSSPLFHKHNHNDEDWNSRRDSQQQQPQLQQTQKLVQLWKILSHRMDTIQAANIPDAKLAGLFGKVKKVHNPVTYLVLAAVAGLRYEWCFRSIFYWFAVGFCVKWYRARYVFKIPVWDRQPNWNNVITSKDQEKDLKAFTCKNCGSTIFIAKTREFFFEGVTGIGGLGCFTCGAKGKENFIMDRDRIVEEVGDLDDYFDYERPLDFVDAAERRKVLKEAQGDEERANQILLDRANAAAGIKTETKEAPSNEQNIVDVEIEPSSSPTEEDIDDYNDDGVNGSKATEAATKDNDNIETRVEEPEAPKPEKKKKVKKSFKKPEAPKADAATDDDLDILGI